MKRINFVIIMFIWLLCTAYTCKKNTDKCHTDITFINNSPIEVYIHGGVNPDTLNFSSGFPNPYNQPNLYRVKSGEKNSSGLISRNCHESEIQYGRMVVYVFDSEVLANYSWGEIGKNYMVLKTIRPTLEDMERDNWTIYFTGE